MGVVEEKCNGDRAIKSRENDDHDRLRSPHFPTSDTYQQQFQRLPLVHVLFSALTIAKAMDLASLKD
jgi:hypothetical protein